MRYFESLSVTLSQQIYYCFQIIKIFSDALIKANIIATQLVINFVIMEFSTVSTRSVISMVRALNTTITHLIQNTGMG